MNRIGVLSFFVPGQPVPKARPRVVQHWRERAQGFTPARTKGWEQTVAAYALQARQAARAWSVGGRYAVTLEIHRADGRGDIDNFAKAALDGCNGILWRDDGQVVELHVTLYRDGDEGLGMTVEVMP